MKIRDIALGGFGCLVLLAIAACGDDGSESRMDCGEATAPAGCGDECSASTCGPGLYCAADQKCSFDCVAGDGTCTGGLECSVSGQCTEPADGAVDAGRDGAVDAGGDGSVSGDAATTEMDACATVSLDADPTIPNITLLVDRSASMRLDLNDTGGTNEDEESRWDALGRVVFASDGPIAATAGSVRYGLALYTTFEKVVCGDPGCPMDMCVGDTDNCPETNPLACLRCPSPSCLSEGTELASTIIRVPPAINQFAAIRQPLLDFGPGSLTPTGDAIDFIRPDLETLAATTGEPTLIILATDGEPNRCENSSEHNDFGLETAFDGDGVLDGMEESLVAVDAAYKAGIRTFVVSLSADVDSEHLQQMANVGQGLAQFEPAATQAQFFLADNITALRDAVEDITGDEVSCELELSSPIRAALACDGEVVLDGTPLACEPGDGNGWFPGAAASDGSTSTIELRGTACETFQRSGGQVTGAFPCFVLLI